MSTFARHHAELRRAVSAHKGREMRTREIKELFEKDYPALNSAWVHPSDHCENHVCKGACECALTSMSIFSKRKRGLYFVR